ncbi:hypothetical protein ALQ04_01669 [Pseudomonas cichorii]|uniref:Phage tail protein n=1 Tax=Pseudomonas cichorii TaxID=36746 RepID=A0A3M4LXU5_PSECI|nr:phage tail assembly chaperone [Pseudomonas cichorii]RMQ45924.1 hypothetical protein ALQ04_01669 [Pseudomonas cichorii]
MKIFYSPSASGFFDAAINSAAQIPDDAVAITAARRNELLEGIATGLVIRVSDAGEPVLVDPPVDAGYVATQERAWRDSVIEQLKWLSERHRDEQDMGRPLTLTDDQFLELLNYLQLLRDWPQSPDFPDAEKRPAAPPWIAEQIK